MVDKQMLAADSEDKLQSIVDQVLAEAKQQGASQAEVSVSVNTGLSTSVRKGEVDTVEYTQDQGFGITVYLGQRKGSASTSDTSSQAIQDTVRAALNIAKFTSEDKHAGLADADLMATSLPNLDLYHPWAPQADETIEMAIACERSALDSDSRITNSEGATVSSGESVRVYGNTHGFIGSFQASRHGMNCVVIAGEGERMQRDYWYDSVRDRAELKDPATIGEKAAERAIRRLEPRKVDTGNYPVLFASEIAGGLMGHFLGAISGGSLYRKSSYLMDSLGSQIFPEFVGLIERPRLRKALGSAAFDGDGLATYEKHFVKEGVVENYVLGTYSARKLDMKSTANAGGLHNLKVSHTGQSYEEMLRELGTGLLVTELMGQGVNMVTGDYSRGAAGFWVENGEIQYPVQEITIAGQLKNMFKRIVAIGDDLVRPGNLECGSVLIEEMTVAGQ